MMSEEKIFLEKSLGAEEKLRLANLYERKRSRALAQAPRIKRIASRSPPSRPFASASSSSTSRSDASRSAMLAR